MEVLYGPLGLPDLLTKVITVVILLVCILLPVWKPNLFTCFVSAMGLLGWLMMGAISQALLE